MQLKARNEGEAVVIEASGRIVLGEFDELRPAIRKQLEDGKRGIVLDLAGVTYLDSAGLGELVNSYTTVTSQGGKLALSSLTPKIRDLLQLTKLITVFPVFDSTGEAVASLQER